MKLPQLFEKLATGPLTWMITLALLQGCQNAALKSDTTATTAKPDTTAKADVATAQSTAISGRKSSQYADVVTRQQAVKPQPATDNTEIKTRPAATAKPTKQTIAAKTTKQAAEPAVRAKSTSAKAKASTSKPSSVISNDVQTSGRPAKTTHKTAARKQHSATATPTLKGVVSASKKLNNAEKADRSANEKTPMKGAEASSTGYSKQANNDPSTDTTSEANTTESSSPAGAQLAFAEPPALQHGDSAISEAVIAQEPGAKLTLDSLPHTFGSWTLERNWDNQHPNTCRLRSAQTTINDGYEATYLWAEILPDEINIYTGSNIDLSYQGSGLRFGSRPVQAFSGFLSDSAVNMAGDYRTMLADSSALTVYLGFWPTWPKTEVQQVDLPAQELMQALPVFEACQAWSE